MKVFYRVLLVILVAVFLFFGWQFWKLSREYQKSSESYSDLTQYVSMNGTAKEPDTSREPQGTSAAEAPLESTDAAQTTAPADDALWPEVDFAALAAINPDIVGWIYVEDTKINYPVVYRDNEYYLNHLFDGTYNEGGCIFLDANSLPDFSGEHSILYGHHMRDGSMFAGIRKYRDQSYYDAHPMAMLITPEGNYRVEFFSGYVASTLESAWKMSFSAEDYGAWLSEIASRSLFAAEVEPTTADRILTLSTCSYEFTEARFVLHGILVPV